MFECDQGRAELVLRGSGDAMQNPWMSGAGAHLSGCLSCSEGFKGGGAELASSPQMLMKVWAYLLLLRP